MKLKIYLRGLGIGIVVTALILGISGGKKEMSDAEVIARAKQLGMVEAETESGKLSQNYGAEKIETEEAHTEDALISESEPATQTEEEQDTVEQESEEAEQLKNSEISEETQAATDKEIVEEVKTSTETIEVTIVSGDDSAAASRRIYEAGLVDSATDLDKYLCSNGYSKKVVSGTYKIPVDADNETIAKIITKNR